MSLQTINQSNTEGAFTRFLQEFHPSRLLPSMAAGLVNGVLLVILSISFAVLIFSGDLSAYLSNGIGIALFSTTAICVVIAALSSFKGTVSISQDSPTAIMALIAASIAGSMAGIATGEETFLTVVAAMACASMLTGVLFLVLGVFNLGGLVRYMPYPVVGGFLAGTGWLLFTGSIGVLTGMSPSLRELPILFQPDMLFKWLSGAIFAVLLLVVVRRYTHFLIMPGMLAGAMGLFYVVLLVTGTSIAEASEQGWMLGTLPSGGLWQPMTLAAITQANWPAVFGQAGSIATIVIVSLVSTLLNASGLEVATEQDIDLNRELRSSGIANIVSGLGGGMTGYHALSLTMLGHKMRAKSRLVGIFAAALAAVTLVFGGTVLAYFPTPVLGGLLMFLGLAFLSEWLYDGLFKLPVVDYMIMLLILVVIGAVGFLEGVGVGLVTAVILFVVTYSRIRVAKHTLSGADRRSNVERPRLYRQLLQQKGHQLYILELQGFIFFGTSNTLLDQVRRRVSDPDSQPPKFVVLDFRLVTGLDSSAVLSFTKMKQLAQSQGIRLVFTHLSPKIRRQMDREVFEDGADTVWRIFPDLDRGVGWCEERMIEMFESVGLVARARTLKEQLEEALPDADSVARLMAYLEQVDVEEGYALIRQGEDPTGLYFVEQGQVTAQLELDDGRLIRLRTMGACTVVGELGVYLNRPATASVVADRPSTLYRLSVDAMGRMRVDDPEIAVAFHEFMAQLLSERLVDNNRTLEALSR